MTCQYNIDCYCVNADCPYCADCCPVNEDDSICKYKEENPDHRYTEKQIVEALEIRMPHDMICREAYDLIIRKSAEIEHLTAENNGLKKFIKDLMKDEEKQ